MTVGVAGMTCGCGNGDRFGKGFIGHGKNAYE